MNEAALWVVATPIGNLGDITLRALEVLKGADRILAEDTRRTAVLLRHHGIEVPLESFHAHSTGEKVQRLVERLDAGETLALVSDAGTPVISDPGVRLVAAAREAGHRVSTAPGPSAIASALSIAGLRADRFLFLGFLPRGAGKRRTEVEAIAARAEASVLFEAPQRLPGLLEAMAAAMPDRRLAVCRELTKRFEEVARGTPEEVLERFESGTKGEVTVVVEAVDAAAPELTDEAIEDFIRSRLEAGERLKTIAKAVAGRSELSGSEAYDRVRAIRDGEGGDLPGDP